MLMLIISSLSPHIFSTGICFPKQINEVVKHVSSWSLLYRVQQLRNAGQPPLYLAQQNGRWSIIYWSFFARPTRKIVKNLCMLFYKWVLSIFSDWWNLLNARGLAVHGSLTLLTVLSIHHSIWQYRRYW